MGKRLIVFYAPPQAEWLPVSTAEALCQASADLPGLVEDDPGFENWQI